MYFVDIGQTFDASGVTCNGVDTMMFLVAAGMGRCSAASLYVDDDGFFTCNEIDLLRPARNYAVVRTGNNDGHAYAVVVTVHPDAGRACS